MAVTEFGASRIMNRLLGGTPSGEPGSWYVGYTMGNSVPQSVGAEPGGNGYARVRVDNTSANWNPPSPTHTVTNATPIQWAPASGHQGTARSIVFYDSPGVGGNAWFYFDLPADRDILAGDAMYIPEGALSITIGTGLFSDYMRDRILASMFGSVPYTVPNTYWVGYGLTSPSDEDPGTEPAGNGYLRVSVPNTLAVFPPSNTGIKTNALDIQWPEATGNQGQILGFDFYDAPAGGNRIFWHPSSPLAVSTGTAPFIQAQSMRAEV